MDLFGAMGGGGLQMPRGEQKLSDTSETVHISSLALLKMLIHGRAGIPLEVMGIMVGEFIDEYTVRVVDVFTIPQTATGQSVEAVDDAYQATMMEKLALVGRPESMVGWYHSHPGFGCWLSGMDVETARSYEQQLARSVSVVVDPVQSVRGKVVIDAFRCIPQHMLLGHQPEPRQTTSNVGFLHKGSIQAIVNGLNKLYYNMPIAYRKNEYETSMLLNVHKNSWREGLKVADPAKHQKEMVEAVEKINSLITQATTFVTSGKDEDAVGNVGKFNPMSHLRAEADGLLSSNLDQSIGAMICAVAF
jgi:26S proteasome regulatory subunit N11